MSRERGVPGYEESSAVGPGFVRSTRQADVEGGRSRIDVVLLQPFVLDRQWCQTPSPSICTPRILLTHRDAEQESGVND